MRRTPTITTSLPAANRNSVHIFMRQAVRGSNVNKTMAAEGNLQPAAACLPLLGYNACPPAALLVCA